jgi:hypothetical protein
VAVAVVGGEVAVVDEATAMGRPGMCMQAFRIADRASCRGRAAQDGFSDCTAQLVWVVLADEADWAVQVVMVEVVAEPWSRRPPHSSLRMDLFQCQPCTS